ncbi:hypothetical protein BKA70DRAFT_1225371 [Coprinopsis sp. MPI-PUGE-AT-0042]|nr:hypothetical protein BKA70DRAFT_1225371 [Coprinopsis sp. MPI-PUGE-AT-0042]
MFALGPLLASGGVSPLAVVQCDGARASQEKDEQSILQMAASANYISIQGHNGRHGVAPSSRDAFRRLDYLEYAPDIAVAIRLHSASSNEPHAQAIRLSPLRLRKIEKRSSPRRGTRDTTSQKGKDGCRCG